MESNSGWGETVLLDEVFAGLLVNASSHIGLQIYTAAKNMRGRTKATDVAASRLLDEIRLTESSILKRVTLPSDVSNATLKVALTSPALQAIVHELLVIRLADDIELKVESIREQWCNEFCFAVKAKDGMGLRRSANELFAALDVECRLVRDQLISGYPRTVDRIRRGAYYARISSTLDAIDRHLVAFANYGAVDRKQDRAYIGQYRRQVLRAHGYITPPD